MDHQEEEYYAEEKREHVATTRSGRKVYSVPRLIVPIPDNEEDMVELAKFDSEHGEDCLDGLSDVSLEGGEGEDGGGLRGQGGGGIGLVVILGLRDGYGDGGGGGGNGRVGGG